MDQKNLCKILNLTGWSLHLAISQSQRFSKLLGSLDITLLMDLFGDLSFYDHCCGILLSLVEYESKTVRLFSLIIGAQLDDMDISPDTSPSSRPSSCAGTPQMGPASTPISLPTPNMAAGHHPSSTPSSSTPFISSIPQLITQISGGQNNQELTNKGKKDIQHSQQKFTQHEYFLLRIIYFILQILAF